jgi:hypothetical protein
VYLSVEGAAIAVASRGRMARRRTEEHRRVDESGAVAIDPSWTRPQKTLLVERRKLAWAAQHAYFERASILGMLNYVIGIPVILITALTGSEIVASRAADEPVPIWAGLITLSATVFASLQTFFRFGERAAFNAQAGNEYAILRRRIEDALASPPQTDRERLINELQKMTDRAGKESPAIGERRWLTWQSYARHERVPRKRSWWRAMVGIPERESRKTRRSPEGRQVEERER